MLKYGTATKFTSVQFITIHLKPLFPPVLQNTSCINLKQAYTMSSAYTMNYRTMRRTREDCYAAVSINFNLNGT